ncbi:cation:proton antiporter subunit C [Ruania suaedae]|uniref:cation:proton antiporter subunit C n=1 Tax=Ruania suaedae TaxID=2897774 RepID=UPI001E2C5E12|nr:cation:proton antiporter subunit C [Ruania suaedae]UFU02950.1 cation:proton antiporter subunit C [Ruania suaedae]
MTIAITAGLLVAGAVYLFMQREMLRIVLGFILLSHAVNLVIIAAGGTSRRDAPFGAPEDVSTVADPLPQAFVLTAIVIAFAITILMLVLSVTGREDGDSTEPTHDDQEPPAGEGRGRAGRGDPESGVEAGAGAGAESDQDRTVTS